MADEGRCRWLKRRCEVCDRLFDTTRRDAGYCSPRCRKRASRAGRRQPSAGLHPEAERATSQALAKDPPTPACKTDGVYLVMIHASGELPVVVSTHDTFAEASDVYEDMVNDPANTFKWIEIAQRQIRRFRLED